MEGLCPDAYFQSKPKASVFTWLRVIMVLQMWGRQAWHGTRILDGQKMCTFREALFPVHHVSSYHSIHFHTSSDR